MAFHWAQFQGRGEQLPVPGYFSHVMVTDLKTGKMTFLQQKPGLGGASFPPLKLQHGEWNFQQQGEQFQLDAGPLQLTAKPLKPAVIHPPGYSGTPKVGMTYCRSITRLGIQGTIEDRPVQGVAWLDHQWGTQMPAFSAAWDWFSLHLAGGDDLMVYRIRDPRNNVVQLIGTVTDGQGKVRSAGPLTLTPVEGSEWVSPKTDYRYPQRWQIQGADLDLTVTSQRAEQELISDDTGIVYWEGPIKAEGMYGGRPETGKGMMELIGGPVRRGAAPAGTQP